MLCLLVKLRAAEIVPQGIILTSGLWEDPCHSTVDFQRAAVEDFGEASSHLKPVINIQYSILHSQIQYSILHSQIQYSILYSQIQYSILHSQIQYSIRPHAV